MFPSRLRSSRAASPRYICSSCSAHVTQASSRSIGRSSCGARAASATTTLGLTRSYATHTSKDSADEAPSDNVKTEKEADKPSASTSASSPAAQAEEAVFRKTGGRNRDASSSKKKDATKVDTKKIPVAPRRKKPEGAQPANDQNDETNQLWKETLALMKELSASPAMRALQKQAAEPGKGKAKRGAQQPAEVDPSLDVVQRQAKMMQGAMGVLKSVLTIQAEKRAQAGRNKKSPDTKSTKPAEKDTNPEKAGAPAQTAPRKKTPSKEVKEEDKKQQPKKKDEQGKLQSKKKESSQEEDETSKKTEESPQKEDKTSKKKGETSQKEGETSKKGESPRKGDEKSKKTEESPQKEDETSKKKGESSQKEDAPSKKKRELPRKEEAPSKKKKGQPSTKLQETGEGLPTIPLVRSSKARSAAKPEIDEKVSQGVAAVVASVQAKGKHTSIRDSIKSKRPQKKASQAKSEAKQARKFEVEKFEALPATALKPIDVKTPPVPLIQYGLDRVLFNEGVYVLQDPRTRVWNFDPYLANIMPVTQFDFDALKEYITSSKDTLLMEVTKSQGKKYTGSTSSMTSTLAHFHYLLSAWRPINPARLSRDFEPESSSFTNILKAPAATILNYKDGAYAIDADKLWDHETVLTMLGKSMEMLLTAPKEEYEKYRRSNSHRLTEAEKKQDESYHYTTFGDFMMRSQLDAYDPRLPGTGVYDLKTRAVVSIRMDALDYHKGVGYQIRTRTGPWESFEREYYDMIRAAFLKYSLQVRMGRMDGIFVAYHNTQRIFGFQYVPLEEMDLSIHGDLNTTLGDREFTASLTLWNKLLDEATARFPEKSLRIHVETRPSKEVPFMYFFAEPVTDDEIKEIQEKKKEDVDRFREQVLGIPPDGSAAAEEQLAIEDDAAEDEVHVKEEASQEENEVESVEEEEDSEQVWADMMDVVDETMENDAQGITAIRDAIQEALEQSGLLHAKSPEEAQHYVEALLKSIVDVNAEQVKGESESESEVEAEASNSDAVAADTAAPKSSVFGLFSRWFGSSSTDPEKPAKESSTPEEKPSSTPEKLDEPLEKVPALQTEISTVESVSVEEPTTLPEDGNEPNDATKEADSVPSPDLVELIMKLTSRVGSSAPIAKSTQEPSDDLEKLQEFEKILIKMMPQPEELQDAQDQGTPADNEVEPDATTSQEQGETEKDILAMVLTVRNVVNDQHVFRPENLKFTDKWHVEYSMEEVTDKEKARLIYNQVQRRRKAAHVREPGRSAFHTAFNGILKTKTRAGNAFRTEEDVLDKSHPAWVVGQPEPFEPDLVFGEGASLDLASVMPSTEHKSWRAPVPRNISSIVASRTPPRNSIAARLQALGYNSSQVQEDRRARRQELEIAKPSQEAFANSAAELRAARDPHFKQQKEEQQKEEQRKEEQRKEEQRKEEQRKEEQRKEEQRKEEQHKGEQHKEEQQSQSFKEWREKSSGTLDKES